MSLRGDRMYSVVTAQPAGTQQGRQGSAHAAAINAFNAKCSHYGHAGHTLGAGSIDFAGVGDVVEAK